MEMLVTKFSHGKYRNEGELFAEVISPDNVKLMGEMIALQALRTIKKFDIRVADKCYIGLIKDLHHMNEVGYIVSDGYDVAQTAICFLYQFVGRKVSEIYGKDRKGTFFLSESPNSQGIFHTCPDSTSDKKARTLCGWRQAYSGDNIESRRRHNQSSV